MRGVLVRGAYAIALFTMLPVHQTAGRFIRAVWRIIKEVPRKSGHLYATKRSPE